MGTERTWERPGYEISTSHARLDMDFVHRELAGTYWSPAIPREVVEKAAANSMVFGIYRAGAGQVELGSGALRETITITAEATQTPANR